MFKPQVKSTRISKHQASKKSIKGIKIQHVKNLSRGELAHLKFMEIVPEKKIDFLMEPINPTVE